MYTYKRKNKAGPGSIIFIILFLLAIVSLAYLFYMNKGLFWDILPFASMVIVIISLIFAIFNFVRRNYIGFLFIIFFIIFLGGIIISSLFGPFSLNYRGNRYFEETDYRQAISFYSEIVNNYQSSRYFDDALINITYSYYHNNDCKNTITSLNKAIDLGLLDKNLKTNKIFIDCYQKLGDSYSEAKNYQLAALNYLKAVDTYSLVKQKYPDSDEAFVAEYKIPELIFKTANIYKQELNWDKAAELFTKVIEMYPDSNYSQQAKVLLFTSYINSSIYYKNNSEYGKSINEFLKTLELDIDQKTSFKISHYKQVILSDIPLSYLDRQGYNFFTNEEYKKAAFLFESIIEFKPSHKETYIGYLAESKINYISETDHKTLSIDDKEEINIGEKSILIIENNSISSINFYIDSDIQIASEIKANSSTEFEISPGTYKAAIEFDNKGLLPLFGNLSLAEGNRNMITIQF